MSIMDLNNSIFEASFFIAARRDEKLMLRIKREMSIETMKKHREFMQKLLEFNKKQSEKAKNMKYTNEYELDYKLARKDALAVRTLTELIKEKEGR